MILDEFIGRNCKRTEYIDARGRHWIVIVLSAIV